MQKILEIERLRAVAILLVIVAHTDSLSTLAPPILQHSIIGVDLFFVISGYVISLSLMRLLRDFRPGKALQTFYRRRVYRILPLVVFWMAASAVLAWLYNGKPGSSFGTPSEIATESFYFCTGLFNYWRDNTAVQGQLWSLNVEEQFYLLLPLLFIFAASRTSRIAVVLAGIFAVVALLRPLIPIPAAADPVSFLSYTSHRRFDQLFLGVLLALIQRDSPARGLVSKNVLKSLAGPALVLLFWATPGLLSDEIRLNSGMTLVGLEAMLLVYLASRNEGYIFGNGWLARILEYIGSRSYSIYLSHVPLRRLQMYYSGMLFNADSSLLLRLADASLALLIYLAAAEVTYRFIEQPFILRGKKRAERREQPAAGWTSTAPTIGSFALDADSRLYSQRVEAAQ